MPPDSVFVMRNKKQVRERRRYLSSVFSPHYLQQMEPVIGRNVRLLINVIEHFDGKPLSAFYWFRLLALDIIGLSLAFTINIRGTKLWGILWRIKIRNHAGLCLRQR
jgi:cytochrome P450